MHPRITPSRTPKRSPKGNKPIIYLLEKVDIEMEFTPK